MEAVMTVYGALEYFRNNDYNIDGFKMKLQTGLDKCYADLFNEGNICIEHWKFEEDLDYRISSVESITEERFIEYYKNDEFYFSGDIYCAVKQ